MMPFSPEELSRYERHFALPQIGRSGQIKLKNSRVLVIGAGGLGSPASLYLAAAGIGQLGIVDHDEISLSNLQRQILYSTHEIHQSKASIAQERLAALNSHIQVICHETKVTATNVLDLIRDYDLVVDGTDNFKTRYLINDACVFLQKPNVFGAVQGFDSQISVFSHADGPCYRCLYPIPPSDDEIPNCSENGVLGVLPGVTGTLQATEAIKLILGIGTSLSGYLLTFNALTLSFSKLVLKRSKDCPACQKGSLENLDLENLEKTTQQSEEDLEISAPAFRARIEQREVPLQLLDVRTVGEYRHGHIEGAIHIPLHELSSRLDELNRSMETIVYCHAGIRSLTGLSILRNAGFTRVCHLKGGLIQLL